MNNITSLNTGLYEEILAKLSQQLTENLSFPVECERTYSASTTYPRVIISEIANDIISASLGFIDTTSRVGYEFLILAQNLASPRKTKYDVINEISIQIERFMINNNFRRVGKPAQGSIDDLTQSQVLRYNAILYNNKNQLF